MAIHLKKSPLLRIVGHQLEKYEQKIFYNRPAVFIDRIGTEHVSNLLNRPKFNHTSTLYLRNSDPLAMEQLVRRCVFPDLERAFILSFPFSSRFFGLYFPLANFYIAEPFYSHGLDRFWSHRHTNIHRLAESDFNEILENAVQAGVEEMVGKSIQPVDLSLPSEFEITR